MNGNSKPISFADAYGLSLIAESPKGVRRAEILKNLSPGAKRIGILIMSGKSSSRRPKTAAKGSVKLARKK